MDEIERAKHHHYVDGIHSTGRGGVANFTTSPTPGIDLPPIHESLDAVISSGRGGAGNIRQASQSRTRGGRE
ncbi:hypothetical protein Clacol_004684 [Clathrus columnatus]|nr:hypothetical protein Clacol_004684 [Clathrus columnatus]